MYNVKLSDQDLKTLFALLDIAVKAAGMNAVEAAHQIKQAVVNAENITEPTNED